MFICSSKQAYYIFEMWWWCVKNQVGCSRKFPHISSRRLEQQVWVWGCRAAFRSQKYSLFWSKFLLSGIWRRIIPAVHFVLLLSASISWFHFILLFNFSEFYNSHFKILVFLFCELVKWMSLELRLDNIVSLTMLGNDVKNCFRIFWNSK